MRTRSSVIPFLVAFLLVASSQAQVSDGTYRALRATNSARVAALGGMVLPFHDGDIQTATFNPSAICPAMHNQLTFSYVGDFNVKSNFASVQYARDIEKLGSFCGSLQYNNYGAFTETSAGGDVMGTFTCSDFAFTLGWGRELTDKWSIGANLKYAGNQYESYQSGAIGVDVAATYWAYSDWAFSLAARNIGRQIYSNFELEDKWLPFSLDFSASKKLEHLPLTVIFAYNDMQKWDKSPMQQNLSYDVITGEVSEEGKAMRFAKNLFCHVAFGGEVEVGKNLVLRAAYNYGVHNKMTAPEVRDLTGFSAGFGIKVKMFEIDYARSRFNIVGSPNFLTVRIDMSKFK